MKETRQTNQPSNHNPPVNRRTFLAGSAAAVASFTVLGPALVRGSQANSRIEVGCVGLGGRGRLIAGMIAQQHAGYQIVALADYFPEVAERAGRDLGVAKERCFSGLHGYKRLLASKVDAVFLETPPCFFPEHCAAGVEAGCHVYMAKPVAVDVPGCLQVEKLGRRATQEKRVFLVDFQVPTEPFNIQAVKHCHEGLIGKIGMLSSIYTDEAFPDPPKTKTIESRLQQLIWVNDIELGGGMLVNAGIHAIDAALWLAGATPVSAMGSSRTVRANPHGDTRDVYSITYQFENGLILNHRGEHLRNTHGFTCACAGYGEHGFVEIAYEGKAWVRGNKGGYAGGEVKNLYVAGISRNLEKFERNIREGIWDNATAQSGVHSTLATILGREAGMRNSRVTWDQIIQENKTCAMDLSGLKN